MQWRLDDASAFNYMLVKKGLCLDSDYPYTSGGGQTGTCQSISHPRTPLSVAVSVDSAFQLYQIGVFTSFTRISTA